MSLRNAIYSLFISGINDLCYSRALGRMPDGGFVLDVGIGNGLMLRRWHLTVKAKQLRIVGIDTDAEYVEACKRLITEFELESHVSVLNVGIESFAPVAGEKFDVVFFSMSFMLMRDPRAVLEKVKPWLGNSGEILFVQTMFKRRSRVREFIKPRLKYLTTIDFGTPTYESDFFALLRSAGLTVTADQLLAATRFGGDLRLIAAKAAN
jgi:alpha-N-acetylglucosaminidase